MKISFLKVEMGNKSYELKLFDVLKFGLHIANSIETKGFVIFIQVTTFWNFFDTKAINLHAYMCPNIPFVISCKPH